jgi:hypothetical protein
MLDGLKPVALAADYSCSSLSADGARNQRGFDRNYVMPIPKRPAANRITALAGYLEGKHTVNAAGRNSRFSQRTIPSERESPEDGARSSP